MGSREDDRVYTCDDCGDETDHPVSVHFPIGGGHKSPLDLCPSCSATMMQKMADRLGTEHGASKILEVKSRQAKPMVKDTDEDEE